MGRKSKTRPLTPLELEIMKVLWDIGPATVQKVQDGLPGGPKLAYTTVQTMLNILQRKGKVKRTLKSRAYEYQPVVSREKAVGQLLRDMIHRMFGGSAESLVMSLVETRHITPEKLARLNKVLKELQQPREAKEARRGND